jgi:hypothetical protein
MAVRVWIITVFMLVQTIGIACSWLWQHATPQLGVLLWGTALVLLVPGNFLAPWIIEGTMWNSGLSLKSMGILATMLLFAINALVWFGLARTIGLVRASWNAKASSIR